MQRNEVSIMVVDDERGFGQLITDILTTRGFVVTAFNNPVEALEKFKLEPADIVISDVKMPQMSGIKLLEEILKINRDVPVIMITAFATVDTTIEALRLGAFNFIKKPFLMDEIVGVVNKAIKVRKILWRKKGVLNQLNPEYFLNIPSSLDQVDPAVQNIIEMIVAAKSLNSHQEMDIAAALNEALTNAVKHGNKLDPVKRVYLKITVCADRVEMTIKDEGEGFDFASALDAEHKDQILSNGGRGVMMMNFYMDQVIFAESGSQVTLIKKLNVGAGSQPAPINRERVNQGEILL